MHARVVLGVGKGLLFSEVSSVQEYSVPLYVKYSIFLVGIWCSMRKAICTSSFDRFTMTCFLSLLKLEKSCSSRCACVCVW